MNRFKHLNPHNLKCICIFQTNKHFFIIFSSIAISLTQITMQVWQNVYFLYCITLIKLTAPSYSGMVAQQLTTLFDLPYVVTGKPASPAVECALPPSSLLLPRHKDHVSFTERQLVLVVLLEVEARLHHLLPTSTIVGHFLLGKWLEVVTRTQV